MITFYALFIPVLVICLFILFVLARHDFVILRRNITLIQIMDKVLIALVIGGVVGRILYIFNSHELYLFHILAFFHLLRNPGFSIFGFFIGFIISLIFLFRKSKILLRMCDIVLLSFFPLILLNTIIVTYIRSGWYINLGVVLLLLACLIIGFRINKNYVMRDGTVAVFLFGVISINALLGASANTRSVVGFVSLTQILAFVCLVLSLGAFIFLQLKKKKK